MRSCGDVILFFLRFKSNTNHFKFSFTVKIFLFSNRKEVMSMQKNKVFTLGPVARGNCNSVNINSVTAVLLQ